jgi:CheY-like chemotaxis protein
MPTEPIHLSSPLRFLIVDDSRAIQAIIRRAIHNCGYEPIEIETALDGEQALDVIAQFLPHLVITDWHMPKVSGLEMVQALRQMGHHTMRVGFVTTEKSPALLAEAMSNGALFILHKPFNDAELVEAVTASVLDVIKANGPPPAAIVSPEKSGGNPVPTEALQAQLSASMGAIPFRLVPDDRMVPEKLTPINLLGLYSASDRKGVFAIGVMDTNAVCIVGGGIARQAPAVVRTAMAAGQPSDAMLSNAQDFMRSTAACLSESSVEAPASVSLAKASIVKNSFAKLPEILSQSGNRSDFRVSVPGYGEGRLAFFVVAA